MEFIFGILLALIFTFLFALVIGIVLSFIGIVGTLLVSKKENWGINCVTVSLSAFVSAFTFCITMFIAHFFVSFGKSDSGFGDYRYVKITDKYSIESLDSAPFYIEDKVDNIAYAYDRDSLFYGKKENGEIFCLNTSNDSIYFLNSEEDKMGFEESELMPVNDYYQLKGSENTAMGNLIAFLVCFVLGIISAIVSYFLFKNTAVWILAKFKKMQTDE